MLKIDAVMDREQIYYRASWHSSIANFVSGAWLREHDAIEDVLQQVDGLLTDQQSQITKLEDKANWTQLEDR